MPTLSPALTAFLLKLAVYAGALALLLTAYEFTPLVGPHARVARKAALVATWKKSSGEWKTASAGWELSFHAAETLRKTEAGQAVKAVNENNKSCDARVSEARRSAQAIKRLLDAPVKPDPAGCPGRVLLDPASLSDAIATLAR